MRHVVGEWTQAASGIARWRLDFDDFGAEVAEQSGSVPARRPRVRDRARAGRTGAASSKRLSQPSVWIAVMPGFGAGMAQAYLSPAAQVVGERRSAHYYQRHVCAAGVSTLLNVILRLRTPVAEVAERGAARNHPGGWGGATLSAGIVLARGSSNDLAVWRESRGQVRPSDCESEGDPARSSMTSHPSLDSIHPPRLCHRWPTGKRSSRAAADMADRQGPQADRLGPVCRVGHEPRRRRHRHRRAGCSAAERHVQHGSPNYMAAAQPRRGLVRCLERE